jgi:hypothetical protein
MPCFPWPRRSLAPHRGRQVGPPDRRHFYLAFIPPPKESYRFLIRPSVSREFTQRSKSEAPMFDVLMLILGIGSFGLFLGYVTVCEIL